MRGHAVEPGPALRQAGSRIYAASRKQPPQPSLEITWIDCYCTLLIFFSAKINSELSLCDSEVVTVPGTFHDGGLWRVCHWAKSV